MQQVRTGAMDLRGVEFVLKYKPRRRGYETRPGRVRITILSTVLHYGDAVADEVHGGLTEIK